MHEEMKSILFKYTSAKCLKSIEFICNGLLRALDEHPEYV